MAKKIETFKQDKKVTNKDFFSELEDPWAQTS